MAQKISLRLGGVFSGFMGMTASGRKRPFKWVTFRVLNDRYRVKQTFRVGPKRLLTFIEDNGSETTAIRPIADIRLVLALMTANDPKRT